jgi:hypothetical protein
MLESLPGMAKKLASSHVRRAQEALTQSAH